MPLSILETTIVKPNWIRVRILDGALDPGSTIGPVTAEPGASYGQIYHDAGAGYYYLIWGVNKNYRRRLGVRPDAYLDRVACDVAANWTITGASSVTVTSLVRKSEFYNSGYCYFNGASRATDQMVHIVDLKLSGNLTQGAHTVTPPAGTGIAAYPWTWNDRTTIAEAFRVSQVGYRPDDLYKKLYLGGTWNEGAEADFSEFPDVQLVNSIGSIVANGTLTQRWTPTTGSTRQVIDKTKKRHVASITPGAAGVNRVVFDNAHGLAGTEKLIFPIHAFSQGTSVGNMYFEGCDDSHNWCGFTVINSTTISLTGAISGTWAPGVYVSRVDGYCYETKAVNDSGTYVYEWEFTNENLPVCDYHGRVPGLGVSRPFRNDYNIYYDILLQYWKGLYNNSHGFAQDGRGGRTRPVTFEDRADRPVYWSRVPLLWGIEGGAASGVPYAIHITGPQMFTTTRAAPGGVIAVFKDAGDDDSLADEHHLALFDHMAVYKKTKEMVSPEAFASMPMDFWPLVSEVHGAGLADLDDLDGFMRMFVTYLYSYKQCQLGDGRVPSGFGVTGAGGTGGSFAASVGDLTYGPSWLTHIAKPFAYAADHVAGRCTVAAFFMLAHLLYLAGKTTRGDEFRDAAIALEAWCDGIDPNITTNRTAFDAYYKTTLGIVDGYVPHNNDGVGNGGGYTEAFIQSVDASTDVVTCLDHDGATGTILIATGEKVCVSNPPAGLTDGAAYYARKITANTFSFHPTANDATNNTNKINITSTTAGGSFCRTMTSANVDATGDYLVQSFVSEDRRILARGAKYLCTGDATAKSYMEAASLTSPQSWSARGHWAYREKETVNTARRTAVYNLLYDGDGTTGARPQAESVFASWRPFDRSSYGVRTVFAAIQNTPAMAYSYMLNPANATFPRAMAAHFAAECGADHSGVCNITGIGHKNWRGHTMGDTVIEGNPIFPGTAKYTYDTFWGYSTAPLNTIYQADAAAAYVFSADSAFATFNNDNHYKQLEPHAWALPYFEQHLDQFFAIFPSEGRTHENVLPGVYHAMIMHTRGDNVKNTPSANGYLMRCRAP